MTLTGGLDAPATARLAVTAWMTDHVDETTLADAQLLLGELLANGVRYGGTSDDDAVRVRAEIRGDALRLEVEDGGSSGSIARRAPDLQRGGGFGLNVVDALSRRWGVDREAGTRVWAEIGLPSPSLHAAMEPHHHPAARRLRLDGDCESGAA
jgi:anti-sigma regulatory factor (Ser/Thr protein kinase)